MQNSLQKSKADVRLPCPPARDGKGEFGFYLRDSSARGGGLFTRGFVTAALYADRTHGWQSLFDRAVRETHTEFKNHNRGRETISDVDPNGGQYTQKLQTPHVFN